MAEFELFSEILDKLIETQVQTAQVTADLKNAVEDNNELLKELKIALDKVNAHFSNGFRQELKESITYAANRLEENMNIKSEQGQVEAHKILKALTDFTSALKSPRSWIAAVLILVSIFGAIAGIVKVISMFMGGP